MRIALVVLALLTFPAAANAASVAYIDNGEVWLSSLDGAQKVRLASTVVNGEGDTEKWLAVAQSDSGRIVAARNKPGRMSQFSWFKVWEPNGSSTVEGPLNAPTGWTSYTYPLGFDITADGAHMVYGYSNTTGFYPTMSFGRGFYVRPVSSSSLEPIAVPDRLHPTLFGSRVIAHSGSDVVLQDPATPYESHFEAWLTTNPGGGLTVDRTDAAANGQLIAAEFENYPSEGKILLLATAGGIGGDLGTPPAIDCFMPVSGVADEVSLSQDARFVAWSDAQGLKVAGTPVSDAAVCPLSSPPVVIAAAGKSASIGGADVSAFLPPAPPTPTPPTNTPPTGTTPTTTSAAPVLTVPAKLTAKSLTKGFGLKVKVGAAGKVTITATVKRVVIATGSATAKGAGFVTVKLKLNAAGRKARKRLKGKKATLRITQGTRSVTKTVTLR